MSRVTGNGKQVWLSMSPLIQASAFPHLIYRSQTGEDYEKNKNKALLCYEHNTRVLEGKQGGRSQLQATGGIPLFQDKHRVVLDDTEGEGTGRLRGAEAPDGLGLTSAHC